MKNAYIFLKDLSCGDMPSFTIRRGGNPRYLLLSKSPVNLVSMFSRPLVWNKAVMSKKFRVLYWRANTVPGKVRDRTIRFRCSAALLFVIKQSKNFNSQINPWLCRGKAKRPRELDLFVVFKIY